MRTNSSHRQDGRDSKSEGKCSRRKLLATLGAGATVGLAGCMNMKRPKSVSKNKYQTPQLDPPSRWQTIGTIQVPRTVKNRLSIYTSGKIYTDTVITDRVNELLPQEVNTPLVALFACQVNVFQSGWGGDLLFGVASTKRVLNGTEGALKRILRKKYGIREFEKVTAETPQPKRSKGHRELRGTYHLPAQSQSVELPNGETKTVQFESTVPIRIFFSSWPIPDSEDFMLVGGVYPEKTVLTSTESVTEGLGVGIDATIEVDLGFSPQTARDRIIKQLKTAKPS